MQSETSLRLLLVGLNHRTAPVKVRERLAFSPAQVPEALALLRRNFPDAEWVLLSTCNRVELYLARPVGAEPRREQLEEFLAAYHGLEHRDVAGHFYHHEDRKVVEHLFEVVASLDSLVLGETQILAQVKQAYQVASDSGTVATLFHSLFQRALAAGKEVHEQTHLGSGRLSVASVAVDLVRSVFDRFDDKVVLCLGAGEMTRLVLQHLQELSPKRIRIANRSPERALELAGEFGASAAPWDCLDQLLVDADIVLSSTGAMEPILTAARFRGLLKARRYRPVVIVDIAVPRDVEAEVGGLSNVYLYNVDDLQQVVAGNREQRQAQVHQTRQLLAGHVEAFLHWFASRDLGPLVAALYAQSHQMAQGELAMLLGKYPQMDPALRRDLEKLTYRLVGKLLHQPVNQMTQQSELQARPMLAAALKKLFQLTPSESGRSQPSDLKS